MTTDQRESKAVAIHTLQQSIGYKSACAKLASEARITERTELIPADLCKAIVSDIDRDRAKPSPKVASDLVKLLMVAYQNHATEDGKTDDYVMLATKAFLSFPESIGRQAVDPVRGLPVKHPHFRPNVGEIVVGLEAAVKRRDLIRANALTHLQEADRRRRAMIEARDLEARRGTEADRAATVARLLRAKAL